jgi:hypothetical protein
MKNFISLFLILFTLKLSNAYSLMNLLMGKFNDTYSIDKSETTSPSKKLFASELISESSYVADMLSVNNFLITEYQEKPPEKTPRDSCATNVLSTRFSLWGSFIYWRPSQSFMDVALQSRHPNLINNNCGLSMTGAKRVAMHPDYRPGFKVGAEYAPGASWGLSADYTFLRFKKHLSRSVHENGFLFARWIQPTLITNNAVSNLSTEWRLNFDVLNVSLAKRFMSGHRFTWKPYFGISSAWIDQRLKGHFALTTPSDVLNGFNKSNSFGIGPRAGIEWDWRMVHHLSIVGNVASAILCTWYDLKLRFRSPNNPTLHTELSDHLDPLRVQLEMYAGLNYGFCISSRTRLNLQAGYDFQVWWNQNMIRWNNDTTFTAIPEGNLYFRGWRFTLGFDF